MVIFSGMRLSKSTIILEDTFQEGYEEFFPDYSNRVRNYLVKHQIEFIRKQRIT